MERIRLGRCSLKEGAVAPFRLIQATGLMMQLRLTKERGRLFCATDMRPAQFFLTAALFPIHEYPSSGCGSGRLGEYRTEGSRVKEGEGSRDEALMPLANYSAAYGVGPGYRERQRDTLRQTWES